MCIARPLPLLLRRCLLAVARPLPARSRAAENLLARRGRQRCHILLRLCGAGYPLFKLPCPLIVLLDTPHPTPCLHFEDCCPLSPLAFPLTAPGPVPGALIDLLITAERVFGLRKRQIARARNLPAVALSLLVRAAQSPYCPLPYCMLLCARRDLPRRALLFCIRVPCQPLVFCLCFCLLVRPLFFLPYSPPLIFARAHAVLCASRLTAVPRPLLEEKKEKNQTRPSSKIVPAAILEDCRTCPAPLHPFDDELHPTQHTRLSLCGVIVIIYTA